MQDDANAAALTDRRLAIAAKSGSADAFALLVERYYAPLLRLLIRQTGDYDLAADLVQETFLDALCSLDRLSIDQPLDLWLYAIARNNRRAAERRQRMRRVVSLDWLHGHEWIAARGREMEAVQERDLIQHALDGLSPTLREVLVLQGVGGLTAREIALVLNLSLPAARQRLVRARREFQRRYRAFGDET